MKGYLGIDNGTQGLSVVFTTEDLHIVTTGDGHYDFVESLESGCFEQRCEDWDNALITAMNNLRSNFKEKFHNNDEIEILAIGISGQMHGEVLIDEKGKSISPVRIWCDNRNAEEGFELTKLFGSKIPKRSTCARFLWTTRFETYKAVAAKHITTPAGWMSYRLTGQHVLGIGDASGMFPIDQTSLQYDISMLSKFDKLVNNPQIRSISNLLPKIKRAGEDSGKLNETGARLLGINTTGIPVAAAEGDQVAAMAGSLISKAGSISCCFGTSVCANSVGEKAFLGVSKAVDHFWSADGKPINMVWLRNGTTFLNAIISSYGGLLKTCSCKVDNIFEAVMPLIIEVPDDCGGLLALPFMHDEPGLDVSHGGSAVILGLSQENSTVGNIAKAALLSVMFNLKIGCEILDEQGYPRNELVLTGGLAKTPECGQILSNVFNTPVSLLESSDEGSSWGAALMAKYRHDRIYGSVDDWSSFLDSIASQRNKRRFIPVKESVSTYDTIFLRYRKLLKLQRQLNDVIS